MSARRTILSALAPALVLALLASADVALSACVCAVPEDVLKCYSEAYASRDVEMLESIVADDYTWVAVTFPRAELFDRETTMQASRGLLTDEVVESCSLDFGDNYVIVAGDDEDTWRIERVIVTLTVKIATEEQPHVSTVCGTFYVRRTDDEPGFEVYREATFEGVGCD